MKKIIFSVQIPENDAHIRGSANWVADRLLKAEVKIYYTEYGPSVIARIPDAWGCSTASDGNLHWTTIAYAAPKDGIYHNMRMRESPHYPSIYIKYAWAESEHLAHIFPALTEKGKKATQNFIDQCEMMLVEYMKNN